MPQLTLEATELSSAAPTEKTLAQTTESTEPTRAEAETAPAATRAAVLDKPEASAVILPYEYREDEHYYVECIEKLPRKLFYSFVKRTFDIFASLFGLVLMALPMLIVAIAIKLDSKGPVLYKQERLGLNGKKFMLVKFRTMRSDAEKAGAKWSDGDDDDRITKVGKVLRKTRIDELPQLWSCFTGKLSLIGPRPEREIFYDAFEEHVHGFRERLKVKPGLTGLAQVSGGYDLRPEEKVVYDVEYIKNRSLLLEIKILFRTVAVIFNHKGAK